MARIDADDFRVGGEGFVFFGTMVIFIVLLVLLSLTTFGAFLVGIIYTIARTVMHQIRLSSEAAKVTEQETPNLYALCRKAAARLDMEMPDVYTLDDDTLNAYAIGFVGDKSVVLHSSLMDHLYGEEILFIIGHEFSHIKAGHTTWLVLSNSAETIRIPIFSSILNLIFLLWSRKTEYTADRGGLIASRNITDSAGALAKLAVGPEMANQIDVKQFIEDNDDEITGLAAFAESVRTHPYTCNRIHELKDFYASETYQKLVSE